MNKLRISLILLISISSITSISFHELEADLMEHDHPVLTKEEMVFEDFSGHDHDHDVYPYYHHYHDHKPEEATYRMVNSEQERGFDDLPEVEEPVTVMAPNPAQTEPSKKPKRYFFGYGWMNTHQEGYNGRVNFKKVPDVEAPVSQFKEVVVPENPEFGFVED